MGRKWGIKGLVGGALIAAFGLMGSAEAAPLRIGYSDWPGWVAWDIALSKGWFKEAGVDVSFQWFDYSASMDAFTAGKLDADFLTNGDTLVLGAGGTKATMILVTDYSSGNDQVIGKPGIKSLADLKGQKVAVEVGLVDHLLLLNGLEKAGMKDTDITLVNSKTNETPQVLASGQVAAICAWQPNSGQAMKLVPGSKPIYTSKDAPGLIYDVLSVNPTSLASRRADWLKLFAVWDRVVKYVYDPKTADDAIKIMGARDGLTPAEYKPLVAGTHLINVADAKKVFTKGPGLDSMYGSTANADNFNVKYAVYKTKQDVGSYIDPSLEMEQK
jgi:NitT/TauT family transport system substrate-binding protein